MARKRILWILPVMALALAGCGGITDGSGEPYINVSGGSVPPKIGDTLRAFSSGAEFSGDFIWEWAIKREDSRWNEITVLSDEYPYNYGTLSGDNDREFTISAGLVDFYLRVSRKTKATDNAAGAWVYSDILGRIQSATD